MGYEYTQSKMTRLFSTRPAWGSGEREVVRLKVVGVGDEQTGTGEAVRNAGIASGKRAESGARAQETAAQAPGAPRGGGAGGAAGARGRLDLVGCVGGRRPRIHVTPLAPARSP